MTPKNLDEIFNEIVETMCESIELNVYDEDTSFSFCYDDNGFYIEGAGTVGGDWDCDGDGYWEPREYHLKYGYGDLEDLSITQYDDETGDEIEIADDTVNEFQKRLDKELSKYMRNY